MIGDNKEYKPIFLQVANKVISNSAAELSLFNDTGARGSRVIPANTLKPGSVLRIRIDGIIGDTGTPTATIRVKIGSSVLINNTATLTAFGQNFYFESTIICTIRTDGVNGTVCTNGTSIIKDPATVTTGLMRSLNTTADVAINTTIDNTFDLSYQFSAASALNNITSRNLIVEIL